MTETLTISCCDSSQDVTATIFLSRLKVRYGRIGHLSTEEETNRLYPTNSKTIGCLIGAEWETCRPTVLLHWHEIQQPMWRSWIWTSMTVRSFFIFSYSPRWMMHGSRWKARKSASGFILRGTWMFGLNFPGNQSNYSWDISIVNNTCRPHGTVGGSPKSGVGTTSVWAKLNVSPSGSYWDILVWTWMLDEHPEPDHCGCKLNESRVKFSIISNQCSSGFM